MTEQDFEQSFWGDCANTYGEETKQLVYMNRMGFEANYTWRSPVSFDGGGKSFIDIGGGPCSVLLKFENCSRRAVADPCVYPDWIASRYASAMIAYWRTPGEKLDRFTVGEFDIALIYNCLQHVEDPEKIIANARAVSKRLCMFEWIDIPPHEGHPHMLTEANLNKWTGWVGRVEQMNESGCVGRAWYI